MIISHKHKFIFVAIPKTGTHAIRKALRPHLTDSDWEQVEHLKSSRFPLTKFENINHGHLSLQEIKPHLDTENYLKFCFVRNPYERFISYAFFRFQGNSIVTKNPSVSMKLLLQNPNHKKDLLLRPQYEFICNQNKEIEVDIIGKVATFQSDFDQLMTRLKLPRRRLEHVNSSLHENAAHYLDTELQEMIIEKYRPDFDLLGFNPNPEKMSE